MRNRLATAVLVVTLFPAEAFATKGDAFSASTLVGSGFIAESLSYSRHFQKPDLSPQGGSLGRRREHEEDDEDPEAQTAPPSRLEFSPFLWNVGYFYARAAVSSEQTDETHGFGVGLEWELLPPDWEASFAFGLQTIPVENYRQGNLSFRLEHTISLQKKKPRPDIDDLEAREYYRRKFPMKPGPKRGASRGAKQFKSLADYEAEEEESRETIPLPCLTVALNVGFFRHIKQPTTAQEPLFSSQFLNQGSTGLEAFWVPNVKYSIRGAATSYYYDASVADFIQSLAVETNTATIASGGVSSVSFPDFVFEESVTDNLNELWAGTLGFAQTFYAAPGQGASFSFAPSIYRFFGRNWTAGLTADLTVGGISAVTGTLAITYGF